MQRRRSDLQAIDSTGWPSVDVNALDEQTRAIYAQRHRAIVRFLAGETVRQIATQTQVANRSIYRLLARCLAIHPDGRVHGYRGLLPRIRVESYTRYAHPKSLSASGSRGTAGAFLLLLERYPTLATWLERQIRERAVVLKQISTDDGLRTRLEGVGAVHAAFIRECRKLGLGAHDYPMSAKRYGIGALTRIIKHDLLSHFRVAARGAGATHLKGLPSAIDRAAAPPTDALQCVEFDAHRLDLRLKMIVQDPLGQEQSFEIERVWLLVILDVYSRAVLGYHVCLGAEYSRYDVIRTIENALAPHRRMALTLAGLSYGPHGGFPSMKFPELAYATWQTIKLDNAKANLAQDTLHALCEFIGCSVDAGPPHSPDDRPYIERFFGTLAQRFSARLPGYTGNSPQDLKRAITRPGGDLRLFVSISELEQLLEVSIADYNGTPHAGLFARTPMETLEHSIRGRGVMLNWLPEAKRRNLYLMQTPKQTRVRGYLAQGIRPHINFLQVRYTNDVLACSGVWLGKAVRLYYNSQDLRTVRAFLTDGTEIGVLKAQGAWAEFAHDITLRREILRQSVSKRQRASIDRTFLGDYVQAKMKQAKQSRRAASELGRTLRILATAPTAMQTDRRPQKSAATPVQDGETVIPASNPTEPAKPQRIEPQTLTIGTGYVT